MLEQHELFTIGTPSPHRRKACDFPPQSPETQVMDSVVR